MIASACFSVAVGLPAPASRDAAEDEGSEGHFVECAPLRRDAPACKQCAFEFPNPALFARYSAQHTLHTTTACTPLAVSPLGSDVNPDDACSDVSSPALQGSCDASRVSSGSEEQWRSNFTDILSCDVSTSLDEHVSWLFRKSFPATPTFQQQRTPRVTPVPLSACSVEPVHAAREDVAEHDHPLAGHAVRQAVQTKGDSPSKRSSRSRRFAYLLAERSENVIPTPRSGAASLAVPSPCTSRPPRKILGVFLAASTPAAPLSGHKPTSATVWARPDTAATDIDAQEFQMQVLTPPRMMPPSPVPKGFLQPVVQHTL